ncbi:MAG: hypothetical protein HFG27_07545 [Provencibacterium sp.]|jgi:5-bromo-4-chloroindolyl phosphate hydrolysis protein|nr:hypothetical protein [Provencibacterium sp.]
MSDILKELFGDNNFTELGRQMSSSVQDALRTGDFSGLKNTVNSTLDSVVSRSASPRPENGKEPVPPFTVPEARPSPSGSAGGASRPEPHSSAQSKTGRASFSPRSAGRPGEPFAASSKAAGPRPERYGYTPQGSSIRAAREQAAAAARSGMTLYAQGCRRSSRFYVLGMLLIAVGIVGILTMGLSFVGALTALLESWLDLGFLLLCGGTGLLLGMSIYAFSRGIKTFGLPSRFRTYCQLLEKPRFCEINQLSEKLHRSRAGVLWDIEQFRQSGMLSGIRMDEKKTCLMLGEEIYQQYLLTQQRQKEREQLETLKEKEPDSADAVIAEGRSRIRQIREANIALPGEEISAKLDRLEEITTRIFAYVEQHRNKLPDIRRFMDYYLPTTVKLVNSYREFESQPVQGKNLQNAKKEILEILDTINTAFERLFDTLYQEDAMDISTDISALKAVLAQEGLAQKDFNAGP